MHPAHGHPRGVCGRTSQRGSSRPSCRGVRSVRAADRRRRAFAEVASAVPLNESQQARLRGHQPGIYGREVQLNLQVGRRSSAGSGSGRRRPLRRHRAGQARGPGPRSWPEPALDAPASPALTKASLRGDREEAKHRWRRTTINPEDRNALDTAVSTYQAGTPPSARRSAASATPTASRASRASRTSWPTSRPLRGRRARPRPEPRAARGLRRRSSSASSAASRRASRSAAPARCSRSRRRRLPRPRRGPGRRPDRRARRDRDRRAAAPTRAAGARRHAAQGRQGADADRSEGHRRDD